MCEEIEKFAIPEEYFYQIFIGAIVPSAGCCIRIEPMIQRTKVIYIHCSQAALVHVLAHNYTRRMLPNFI